MARTLYRLTDRIVRSSTAPGYHADGGGLYLQISRAGTKSWVYRFTLNGRTRDKGLGAFAVAGLTEARTRAAECRALVARDIDPIDQEADKQPAVDPKPATAPPGPTFRDFAEQYIDAHAKDWTNEKHQDQWRATLQLYVYPLIGDRPLADIDTPDVLRILEPIWAEKSETASRVRGRIERILAAGSVRGLRAAGNPATWIGHLREALPAKTKSVPFAAVPYSEIPAFMADLRRREGVGARALEFTVLTGARSGESRGARWPEIDMQGKQWTVPQERMKARPRPRRAAF